MKEDKHKIPVRSLCGVFFLFLLLGTNISFAQSDTVKKDNTHNFTYRDFIFPAALMGIGGVEALGLNPLKINQRINNFIVDKWSDREKTTIDDKLQLVPMVAVYALNLCQYRGQHEFFSRSVILINSAFLTLMTVRTMKNNIKFKRPDSRSYNSFPSGHTATAFMGAEFMWQEYKDKNKIIAYSGYGIATATAMLRIYNHRHWFGDVCMGAGIGIFYTKLSYMIYPFIRKLFIWDENKILIMPYCYNDGLGVSLSIQM